MKHPSEYLRAAFKDRFQCDISSVTTRELPKLIDVGLTSETLRKAFLLDDNISISNDNYIKISNALDCDSDDLLISVSYWKLPKDTRAKFTFSKTPEQQPNYTPEPNTLKRLLIDLEEARGNSVFQDPRYPDWIVSSVSDRVFSHKQFQAQVIIYPILSSPTKTDAETIARALDQAEYMIIGRPMSQKIIIHTSDIPHEIDAFFKEKDILTQSLHDYLDIVFCPDKLLDHASLLTEKLLGKNHYLPPTANIHPNNDLSSNVVQDICSEYLHQTRGPILITGPYGAGKSLAAYISCLRYAAQFRGDADHQIKAPLIIPMATHYKPDQNRSLLELCQVTCKTIIQRDLSLSELQHLIANGYIIPIFDGIDEVSPSQGYAVMKQFFIDYADFLNSLFQNNKATSIVTLRNNLIHAHYDTQKEWAHHMLPPNATIIELHPFTSKEIQLFTTLQDQKSTNTNTRAMTYGYLKERTTPFSVLENKSEQLAQLKDNNTQPSHAALSKPFYLSYFLSQKNHRNLSETVLSHNLIQAHFFRDMQKRRTGHIDDKITYNILEDLALTLNQSNTPSLSLDTLKHTLANYLSLNDSITTEHLLSHLLLTGLLLPSTNANKHYQFETPGFQDYFFTRRAVRRLSTPASKIDLSQALETTPNTLSQDILDNLYQLTQKLLPESIDDTLLCEESLLHNSLATGTKPHYPFPLYSKTYNSFHRKQIPFAAIDNIPNTISMSLAVLSHQKPHYFNNHHWKNNDFSFTKLTGQFNNCQFSHISFAHCTLTHAKFINCSFNHCLFENTISDTNTFQTCQFANIYTLTNTPHNLPTNTQSTHLIKKLQALDLPITQQMTLITPTNPSDQHLLPFYIDNSPVSKADFSPFLEQNPDWSPANIRNATSIDYYLHHWPNTQPDADINPDTLVHVNFEAAAAYAKHNQKRLPTLAEWNALQDSDIPLNEQNKIWHWMLDSTHPIQNTANNEVLSLTQHHARGKTRFDGTPNMLLNSINTNSDFGFRCVLPVCWLL